MLPLRPVFKPKTTKEISSHNDCEAREVEWWQRRRGKVHSFRMEFPCTFCSLHPHVVYGFVHFFCLQFVLFWWFTCRHLCYCTFCFLLVGWDKFSLIFGHIHLARLRPSPSHPVVIAVFGFCGLSYRSCLAIRHKTLIMCLKQLTDRRITKSQIARSLLNANMDGQSGRGLFVVDTMRFA